jgi:hypothetical protein
MHAGKDQVVSMFIPEINICFNAAERNGNVVNYTVNELIKVQDGANLPSGLFQAEQVMDLIAPERLGGTKEAGIARYRSTRHVSNPAAKPGSICCFRF